MLLLPLLPPNWHCRVSLSGPSLERVTESDTPNPRSQEPAPGELASLRADFPGFRIREEATADRNRYVARRLNPGTRPHTVVTDNLTELRAALAAQPGQQRPAARFDPGTPHPARV